MRLCHDDVKKVLFQNGGRDWGVFQREYYENQASPHSGMQ